jgi:hypothetical protein
VATGLWWVSTAIGLLPVAVVWGMSLAGALPMAWALYALIAALVLALMATRMSRAHILVEDGQLRIRRSRWPWTSEHALAATDVYQVAGRTGVGRVDIPDRVSTMELHAVSIVRVDGTPFLVTYCAHRSAAAAIAALLTEVLDQHTGRGPS